MAYEFARRVHGCLALGSDREVVPASSATAALHATVGMHQVRAGRPLVWAISAFGFMSTAIGPLAGSVRCIDCDETGMLDLDQLRALSPESWDGLIITDIFGLQPDFRPYQEHCDRYRKPMIIDSATSFPAKRHQGVTAEEVISFHHTKPWGFGEGGCAIVDSDDAATIRSLLNFGVSVDDKRFAMNGKISDVAAAAIIDRLDRFDDWSDGYREQRKRLASLAGNIGLQLLNEPPASAVIAHVPVLARGRVRLESLHDRPFAVEKYYKPLGSGFRTAERIYGRIANLPCHGGLSIVDDASIVNFLKQLSS